MNEYNRKKRLPLLLAGALSLGVGAAYLGSSSTNEKPAVKSTNDTKADTKTAVDALSHETKTNITRTVNLPEKSKAKEQKTNDPEINLSFENQLNWLARNYKNLPKAEILPERKEQMSDGTVRTIVEMDMDYNYIRGNFKKRFSEIVKSVLLSNESERQKKIKEITDKLGIDNGKLADLGEEIYVEEMAEYEGFVEIESKIKAEGRSFFWEDEEGAKIKAEMKAEIELYRQFATCVRTGQCDPFPGGTANE